MTFWGEGLPDGIDKDTALFILLINIIMPGVGTIISAALASEFMTVTVIIGVAQLVTSFIVIGFIWAIVWSVLLIKKTRSPEYQPILPTAATEPAAAVPDDNDD